MSVKTVSMVIVMSNTTKGVVNEKFDADDNKPFMLYIDDDKYSTFEEPDNWSDVSEGDRVELEWFENDAGYKTIEAIEVVDRGVQKGSSVESPDGSKDARINRKVALKSAVEYTKGVDEDVEPATVTSIADDFRRWLDQ